MSANLSEPKPKLTPTVVPRGLRLPGSFAARRAWLMGALVAFVVLVGLAWPAVAQQRLLRAGGAALALAEQAGDEAAAARAVDLLGLAVEADPRSAVLRQRLARAYELDGQPDEALAEWEQAWRLRPDGTLTQQALALAYERAGRYEEADTLWRSLGLHAAQMRALADQFAQAGDHEAARQWRERAQRID